MLCLLWEFEARRAFQYCLSDEVDLAAFDTSLVAVLKGAGLQQHPHSTRYFLFSDLDLDRLPGGKAPFHEVHAADPCACWTGLCSDACLD